MWWFNFIRRLGAGGVAVFMCLLLTACGFQPLYGGGDGSIVRRYAEIEIANIPDREGQYLRNALIDRIYTQGYPRNARYILEIDPLKMTSTALGIQRDATVTRTEISIVAHLRLIDVATNTVLLDRDTRAVGGYDVLDQQYTTLITRRNAIDHILDHLSSNITSELDVYFRRVDQPR